LKEVLYDQKTPKNTRKSVELSFTKKLHYGF
jgi:uncharacterized protein (UPF0147 family)